jgi:hypothetical protein
MSWREIRRAVVTRGQIPHSGYQRSPDEHPVRVCDRGGRTEVVLMVIEDARSRVGNGEFDRKVALDKQRLTGSQQAGQI